MFWKNLSKKARVLVVGGIAVVVLAGAAGIGSVVFQVDMAQARETALNTVGGGEVVSQEMDREGLWNEYSFDILNGQTRYEVEVNAFGQVTGMETNQGGYAPQGHWD